MQYPSVYRLFQVMKHACVTKQNWFNMIANSWLSTRVPQLVDLCSWWLFILQLHCYVSLICISYMQIFVCIWQGQFYTSVLLFYCYKSLYKQLCLTLLWSKLGWGQNTGWQKQTKLKTKVTEHPPLHTVICVVAGTCTCSFVIWLNTSWINAISSCKHVIILV